MFFLQNRSTPFNRQPLLVGEKRNFTLRLERILGFSPFGDGAEIIKDSGRNPILQLQSDADIFCLMLSRLLRET